MNGFQQEQIQSSPYHSSFFQPFILISNIQQYSDQQHEYLILSGGAAAAASEDVPAFTDPTSTSQMQPR